MTEYRLSWYCPSEPDIMGWQGSTDEDLEEYYGLVDYLENHTEEIDPQDFFKVIPEQTVLDDLMYGSIYDEYMKIEDDDTVSWYKSQYPDGTEIYYHTHSGIEHVYEPNTYSGPIAKKAMSKDEITTVCMYCKKVLKEGIHGLDPEYFSHGVCVDCLREHFPPEPGESEEEWLESFGLDKKSYLKQAIQAMELNDANVFRLDLKDRLGQLSEDEKTKWERYKSRHPAVAARFAKKAYKINKEELHTLWYENEKGDKWVPDFENDPLASEAPKDYKYQVSRFPNNLQTNYLEILLQKDVDACKHPEEDIRKTYGWIDGVEGRECSLCGGTQTKNVDDDWPEKWDGYGSRDFMTANSTWSEDLALAMANSGDYTLSEAIIVAAEGCERCMNSMAHDYGLDWGYPEHSEEWQKSGTVCEFCEGEDV